MQRIQPPEIKDRVSYIDTVSIWLPWTPPKELMAELGKRCGTAKIDWKAEPWPSPYRRRMQLHQPMRSAFRLLEKVFGEKSYLINEVHIALDLIVSRQQRERLEMFLDDHIVQRWHVGEVIYHKGTRYSNWRKWPNSQIVIYSDKPSKVTGQPCVHVEWRSRGSTKVRQLKVKSFSDLIMLDHREFWRRHFILEYVDVRSVGRQTAGLSKARKPERKILRGGFEYVCDRAIRAGNIVLRAEGLMFTKKPGWAQQIRDWANTVDWCHTPSIMKRMDNDAYLPEPSEYLAANKASL